MYGPNGVGEGWVRGEREHLLERGRGEREREHKLEWEGEEIGSGVRG